MEAEDARHTEATIVAVPLISRAMLFSPTYASGVQLPTLLPTYTTIRQEIRRGRGYWPPPLHSPGEMGLSSLTVRLSSTTESLTQFSSLILRLRRLRRRIRRTIWRWGVVLNSPRSLIIRPGCKRSRATSVPLPRPLSKPRFGTTRQVLRRPILTTSSFRPSCLLILRVG